MMSSSQCIVPKWNLSQHRQKQVDEARQRNNTSSSSSPSHVFSFSTPSSSCVVPMSDYEIAELTWQNGQIALHELIRGNLPSQKTQTTSATWEKPGDHTLESIVHQATFPNSHQKQAKEYSSSSSLPYSSKAGHMETMSEGAKWRGNFGEPREGDSGNLRMSGSEADGCFQEEEERASACVSASAAFCRDTTMMTWNSIESTRSLKSCRNADDDSTYHLSVSNSENQEGGRMTKGESFRRRSRAAAIHNQSERRRRDRINEKMRALQKLVPNASKMDKASMLDEVIDYLKQLQAQVQMMSTARNMQVQQMVMPPPNLGMQQQLQMSLLAGYMGMGGMGMGMVDVNNLARNMPPSLPPLIHGGCGAMPSLFMSPTPQPFSMPQAAIPNFNDGYHPFFAQQSMNMDFLNKMTALYRQQQTSHVQTTKKPHNPSTQPNNGQPES